MSSGGVDLSALAKAGFSTSGGGGGGGGGGSAAEQEEKRAAQEDARNAMLKTILTPEAKERLARVAIVKPENARAVEEHVIRLARAGKLGGQRVDENSLVSMLEQVGKAAEQAGVGGVRKVTIQRKKRMEDDDDDDDDF